MINLYQSLSSRERDALKIMGVLLGIEDDSNDKEELTQSLLQFFNDPVEIKEVLDTLPLSGDKGLEYLAQIGGKLPLRLFVRKFGDIREMGIGKIEREEPYYHPISVSEVLWYRGLIGRSFFNTPAGAEEFVYIPDELMAYFEVEESTQEEQFGSPARKKEVGERVSSGDHIVDHAVTLLAGLRSEVEIDLDSFIRDKTIDFLNSLTIDFLRDLFRSMDVIDNKGALDLEKVKDFLEITRGNAQQMMVEGWISSEVLDDLSHVPNLEIVGEIPNKGKHTRGEILSMLDLIPPGRWWNLESFVEEVYRKNPDFLRSPAEYSSWLVRDQHTKDSKTGFENWNYVEGDLIRFVIGGPLHWLGITELARPKDELHPVSFMITKPGKKMLAGDLISEEKEMVKAVVSSDGYIHIPPRTSRSLRYQIARFTDWERRKAGNYVYKITVESLERAKKHHLTGDQLVKLLKDHDVVIPPSLEKGLKRWKEFGTQVKFTRAVILQVTSSAIIDSLNDTRAARFLGERLNPNSIVVNEHAVGKVLGVLLELGFLGEVKFRQEDHQLSESDQPARSDKN